MLPNTTISVSPTSHGRANAAILLLASTLTGCNSKQVILKQQQEVISQSEDLSRRYFGAADISTARECLQRNAKLLEAATVLEPSGRAQLLSLTYFRLYSLEKRNADSVAADASLIKARYWRLLKWELAAANYRQVVKEIEQLTPERILDEVDQFDRKHNNGNRASYMVAAWKE
jgi:hypothetical protein